jgi:hypothetical protein
VSEIESLLSRPLEQRAREFKYRFAQAVIFGLPVLALQWFGGALGGPADEARRWVAVLQALLAGWVTYVAAVGIVAEGLLSRRITLDFIVGGMSILLYLFSLGSVIGVVVRGQPFYAPLLFHVAIILLAIWCGIRWRIMLPKP